MIQNSHMGKGRETRCAILEQALDLSSQVGLEGLTFGVLAKRAGMSKSGLYAHFASKEGLQCEVLDAAAERFIGVVLGPALKQPRGLARIEKLFERWLRWGTEELAGGCLFVAAATEFDDRKGPVRDRLVKHIQDMLGAIARAAQIGIDVGDFRRDLDTEQFAYEFWALLMAHQHYGRLLVHPDSIDRAQRAFGHLIGRARPGLEG